MSEREQPEIPEFGPVETTPEGYVTACHEESGWRIQAPDRQMLDRMADFVRKAARLRRQRDGL